MADIGIFTDRVFHPTIFDTGEAVAAVDTTMAPPDRETLLKFRRYQQVLREDEEILAIILSSVTSGMFDT